VYLKDAAYQLHYLFVHLLSHVGREYDKHRWDATLNMKKKLKQSRMLPRIYSVDSIA
jgi:hypothetical protein